jgi:hypothetical protein
MKTKHALLLLLLVVLMDAFKGPIKIDEQTDWTPVIYIALSAVIKTVGSVVLISKLITYPRIKEFMNW